LKERQILATSVDMKLDNQRKPPCCKQHHYEGMEVTVNSQGKAFHMICLWTPSTIHQPVLNSNLFELAAPKAEVQRASKEPELLVLGFLDSNGIHTRMAFLRTHHLRKAAKVIKVTTSTFATLKNLLRGRRPTIKLVSNNFHSLTKDLNFTHKGSS
jgi:hypothetical protein